MLAILMATQRRFSQVAFLVFISCTPLLPGAFQPQIQRNGKSSGPPFRRSLSPVSFTDSVSFARLPQSGAPTRNLVRLNKFFQTTRSKMLFMSNDDAPLDEKCNTSLASSYVIHATEEFRVSEYVWRLAPIDSAAAASEADADAGVGTMAIRALRSSSPPASSVVYTLRCKVEKSEVPSLKLSIETGVGPIDKDDILLEILARVLVQWAGTRSGIEAPKVEVSLPGEVDDNAIYSLTDILGDDVTLFQSYIGDGKSSTEMSEMVDCNGVKLGAVPRPLVHIYNLLHRGIGMVVSKDEHIKRNTDKPAEVYVHRRTDTKKIFPSLYDMFVGGVSTAGEDARLTAAREVAEELGLKRALDNLDGDALSGPLFKCTVCTSYNRCIVTMFTYEFKSEIEEVRWQEEEVAWGDFVPYSVVKRAARLSIDRLKKDQKWPGTGAGHQEKAPLPASADDDEVSFGDGSWKEWDFVPDGLLVWEAWVLWKTGKG